MQTDLVHDACVHGEEQVWVQHTRRSMEDSVFAHRKFNFLLLPGSNLTKKVWGRLAAKSQENRCCRQAERAISELWRTGHFCITYQAFLAACCPLCALVE